MQFNIRWDDLRNANIWEWIFSDIDDQGDSRKGSYLEKIVRMLTWVIRIMWKTQSLVSSRFSVFSQSPYRIIHTRFANHWIFWWFNEQSANRLNYPQILQIWKGLLWDIDVFDFHISNGVFTWSNQRQGRDIVKERLGRIDLLFPSKVSYRERL